MQYSKVIARLLLAKTVELVGNLVTLHDDIVVKTIFTQVNYKVKAQTFATGGHIFCQFIF